MEKIFLMSPRQSGKTDKALYEYLKDPENTIFISPNLQCAQMSCSKINGNKNNFISFGNLENKLVGKRPKTIILDEYMIWGKKEKINSLINYLNPERLLIFSTSDKIYRQEVFDYVKKYKYDFAFYVLESKFLNEYPQFNGNKEVLSQLFELYYNFITDNDIKLINSGFDSGILYKEGIKEILGDYRFRLEILNEYLTDEEIQNNSPRMVLKYNI